MNTDDYQPSLLDEAGDVRPELLGRTIPSRRTDPDTSKAAGELIKIRAGSQRALLLGAFWNFPGGLTDEQAMKAAHGVAATSEYSKRCSELREGGYIEPTGETRPGAAGPQRIVSRITPKGVAAWVKLDPR